MKTYSGCICGLDYAINLMFNSFKICKFTHFDLPNFEIDSDPYEMTIYPSGCRLQCFTSSAGNLF